MSMTELENLVSSLTLDERSKLREILNAAEEGVSVQEFRAMNAAIAEALDDPVPSLPAEQVFAELHSLYPSKNAGPRA